MHNPEPQLVEVFIDGKPVTVMEETFILQAANKAGVTIPAFCDDERLRSYGACRMCLVQVEGKKRIFPACTTPVAKGMKIITNSPEIQRLRQTSLELILLHHPLDCPVCEASGECQLQDYAFSIGKPGNRFTAARRNETVDKRAPLIEIDNNRCILCGKCVRICDEVQGVHALDFAGRGLKTRISPAFGKPLDCEFCGQCISVCPVGALYPKTQKYKARVWQLKNTKTVCNYCGTGCTFELRTLGNEAHRVWAPLGDGVNNGNLCGKGRFGFEFVHSKERILKPLIRKNGALVETTWNEALGFVAGKIKEVGAGAVAALGSPRATNEEHFLFSELVRKVIGSTNIDSCVSFGQTTYEEAMKLAFGGRSSKSRTEKFRASDLVIVIESDISDFSPVFSTEILRVKSSESGSVVALNAKKSKVSHHANLWLKVKPTSSVALLNALAAALIADASAEVTAIKGFKELQASVASYSLAAAAKDAGVTVESLTELLELLKASHAPVITLSLGMHETTKGMETLLAAANLMLLKGRNEDSLIVHGEFAGLQGLYEYGIMPQGSAKGFSEWKNGGVKALYVMGEDPSSLYADKKSVDEFLAKLDLLVVQDSFLTETAKKAHVVLPAATYAEKNGTMFNSDLVAQKLSEAFAPVGESKTDFDAMLALAAALGKPLPYKSPSDVIEKAAAAVKLEDRFAKGDSKSFNVVKAPSVENGDTKLPLRLFFGNQLHHSGTLGTRNPGLMSAEGHSELIIGTADAKGLGVVTGDKVKIVSAAGEALSTAKVSADICTGYVYSSIHFPSDNMNAVLPKNGGSALFTIPVKVEKA